MQGNANQPGPNMRGLTFWWNIGFSVTLKGINRHQNSHLCKIISIHLSNGDFSRPVPLPVVTMETVGQTNLPSVTTGSPLYLTTRSS